MITNQNYFQYKGKFYKPTTGVAMGSPLSSILAEIFLQDLEQNRLKHLLEDKKIVHYNRYIHNIFIIYDQRKITPPNHT
jgi:glycyl-tRNA synthetase beta subunit